MGELSSSSRFGCVERPTSHRISLEGTCCVRVWVVFRDLLLGFNYVYHPVLKEDSLFQQPFPLTCLIHQQACSWEPKGTEK
jgi:hypothetical protein